MVQQYTLHPADQPPPIRHVMDWTGAWTFTVPQVPFDTTLSWIDPSGYVQTDNTDGPELSELWPILVTFVDGSQSVTNRRGLVKYCQRTAQLGQLPAEVVTQHG